MIADITSVVPPSVEDLAVRWAALRASEPGVRSRDAARRLGVSEGELVASEIGHASLRLSATCAELVGAYQSLGRVMSLTRNDACVHERWGVFESVEVGSHVGIVLGPDIDLRLFPRHWLHVFARPDDPRPSIQVFDAAGHAVHKLFLGMDQDRGAFDRMLDRLASDDQTPGLVTTPQPPTPSPAPDDMIDIAALRTDWLALKDTHDFFALLRRHGVDRVQAFRLIGDDLAARAEVVAADQLLERVAAEGLPIMVFTGNPGCIQIHTGTVQRVMRAGPWQNVLDPDFNLHLDTTRVAHAFVVRKPSVDGTITSLELFDSVGRQIVTFFGKRKPGEPERPDWRSLVEGLAA